MARLEGPNGETIIGTLENIPGRAGVIGATRNPDGSFNLDYEGGTEMFWDDSKTVQRNGQDVYLDEDGEEHLANTLVLVEEDNS